MTFIVCGKNHHSPFRSVLRRDYKKGGNPFRISSFFSL
ncbi:hypothetical protein BACUNI_04004 [Bacteroides uniformis ATCC 8492]|uniref:Uncharacterized protein n=1 Tax=Bacteroides uniformis (strain ATCC 8492 / DSM 6597 / CCUG 4942 / CIP 103695 / JCM 5828 / KCTC 5204 / NCTC 13054 / VPI 0061) TaxID=411479 RepID=A0ABC9N6Y0_BACUC|nr:hypothetical protein BACUNI_04004 [Bacteroides uniformis ATCC 8492]